MQVPVEGDLINVIGRDDLIKNKKATDRPKDALDVAILEKQKRRG